MTTTVVKMEGTSPKLYGSVAPLVMNPDVIKYNHNYPFKTNESFVWFVAFQKKKVVGFLPVEIRKKAAVINNYYVGQDEEEVFKCLLDTVEEAFRDTGKVLEAVVQKIHESYFLAQDFEIERTWSVYFRMKKIYEKR